MYNTVGLSLTSRACNLGIANVESVMPQMEFLCPTASGRAGIKILKVYFFETLMTVAPQRTRSILDAAGTTTSHGDMNLSHPLLRAVLGHHKSYNLTTPNEITRA